MLTNAKHFMILGGGRWEGEERIKGEGEGGEEEGRRVWKEAGGRGMTGDPPISAPEPKTSAPYSPKPPPG